MPLLNAHRLFIDDTTKLSDTIANWYENWGTFYIIVGVLYLPFIFSLQRLWRGMPKVEAIRHWVLFHNIAFCIFSTVGAIELTSTMYETWVHAGWNFHHTVCDGYFLSRPESHWVFLFVLSKILELPESIYLILEKKPLGFLHWYHHFVTYTFSVHALVLNNPSALYYSWMNLVVHAIMYFYYALATVSHRRPSWGIIVTISQIIQMFVGVFVTYEVFRCEQSFDTLNSYFGFLMYLSYVVLFVRFFILRYVLPSRSQKPAKDALKKPLAETNPTSKGSPKPKKA